MKRFDVTALGELLIDFTENGKSSQGNIMMEANKIVLISSYVNSNIRIINDFDFL